MNEEEDFSNFSMLDLFCMEVETQAAILNENLLILETNVQSTEALEALMRGAHSIKGAARIVDIEAAVKIAHGMEDCFAAAQAQTITLGTDHIDSLLRGVDFLRRLGQVGENNLEHWLAENQSEINGIENSIARILQPNFTPDLENSAVNTHPITPSELVKTHSPPLSPHPFPETTPENLENSIVAASPLPPSPTVQSSKKSTDRVVRISSENLNRLMGLAGESLVESNWLQPFADSLLKLKYHHLELSVMIEKLQESLTNSTLNEQSQEYLNLAKLKQQDCQEYLMNRLNELELFTRRSIHLSDRLYREVIASHLRPFADGIQGLPRMVRDLAKNLGKQVKLDIVGHSTPVDRDILEKLEAPLTHILRNAVDHGIELPEQRIAAGKPMMGTIKIEALHRAGMLSISISDDGQGIDLNHLRQRIVHKQLATLEMVNHLTEKELMDFLFLPGFSTAHQVTEISGRGVGLDIAQSMVQEVGGTIRAVSQFQQGLAIHFQLPLTLSVIRTLLVEISGESYGLPLNRIDQVYRISRQDIAVVENRQYFTVNGENIGLLSAYQVLDLKEPLIQSEALSIIVISDSSYRYGLAVDRFIGERDLVVRPLDPRLGKIPDISAAAFMEDGSLVLIIDVADLVRSIETMIANGKLHVVQQDSALTVTKKRKKVLVVDDSITVREMERKLLENKGYDVEIAINGMEGWNAVRTGNFDLVITDIDMPRMNGIELVSQIKSHSQLSGIPVIIVSYKDREEDRMRGLEVGANYYLTKSSFHDNTLLTAVTDLIGSA